MRMSGRTAKASSASHQLMLSMTMAMMRQGEEVVDDGEHAAGEHLVDGVHVGGEAGDQAADGVRVEEADVHALHVAEDVAAQIEHDLLAGPLHQVGLNEFEEVGGKSARPRINGGQLGDAAARDRQAGGG